MVQVNSTCHQCILITTHTVASIQYKLLNVAFGTAKLIQPYTETGRSLSYRILIGNFMTATMQRRVRVVNTNLSHHQPTQFLE